MGKITPQQRGSAPPNGTKQMTKPAATFAEIEAWLIEDAGDIADRLERAGVTGQFGVLDSIVKVELDERRAEYLRNFNVTN